MSARFLALAALAVALALAVDFAFIDEPQHITWMSDVRGYWLALGFAAVAGSALVLPYAARLLRRGEDYYDESDPPEPPEHPDGADAHE